MPRARASRFRDGLSFRPNAATPRGKGDRGCDTAERRECQLTDVLSRRSRGVTTEDTEGTEGTEKSPITHHV